MFVSVKERARQIANGQFLATPTSAPATSLIDLAPEPQPAAVATAKTASRDAPAKPVGQQASPSHSKTKPSKTTPQREPTPKAAPPKATPPPATAPKTTPPKTTAPPEASPPKKAPSKSKTTKEPSSKPSSPKLESSKPSSSGKVALPAKAPCTPKPASAPKVSTATKAPRPKSPSSPSKPKRSKSPPKRVDSPMEDDADPLSALRSACLKQVSSVTGLGGRRLTIVLKQRSSGAWYAALKDSTSDKYLKMWTNRDRTYASPEEALEAYLAFATKMRNEMRWFPMSPRASSPKAKGK